LKKLIKEMEVVTIGEGSGMMRRKKFLFKNELEKGKNVPEKSKEDVGQRQNNW